MSWVVFFMLKVYGRVTWVWSFFTSDLASLYALPVDYRSYGGVFFVDFYKASYFWCSGI